VGGRGGQVAKSEGIVVLSHYEEARREWRIRLFQNFYWRGKRDGNLRDLGLHLGKERGNKCEKKEQATSTSVINMCVIARVIQPNPEKGQKKSKRRQATHK